MYIQSKLWNPESRARKHVVVDSEQLMSGGNWLRESFESVVFYFSTCESTCFLLMLVFCTNSHSEKKPSHLSAAAIAADVFIWRLTQPAVVTVGVLHPSCQPTALWWKCDRTLHLPLRFFFFFFLFFVPYETRLTSLTRIDSAWHLDATWDSKHMLQSTLLRTAVRTHTRTWADEDFICAASHERKPSSRASSALFRGTR